VVWAIEEGGCLRESVSDPDLTLTVSPMRLPALLAQPARWKELVTAQGDEAFAATLADLALALPLLVEQALSRGLGPIAGALMADAGRSFLTFPDYVAQRVNESIARYVVHEAELAVGGEEVRAFAADVAALAERLDALDARLVAIAAAPGKRAG